MYELLIIPKKHTVFTIEDMLKVAEKHAKGKTIETNPTSLIIKDGGNSLTISFAKSDSVLQEAQEMAARHGIPVENTDNRFEMYGNDSDDVLYNQFLLIFEHLRDSRYFYILDQFTGELTGKNTPLTQDILHNYIYEDFFIGGLEKELANQQQHKFNLPKSNHSQEPRFLQSQISKVKWVGVNNLEDLVDLLHTKKAEILAMEDKFGNISEIFYLGTSLKYLSFELIALSKDEEKITQFVQECVSNETYKKLSKLLFKVYS